MKTNFRWNCLLVFLLTLWGAGVAPSQAITLLRLDANVGVEQAPSVAATNGAAVSRWLDQSGLGNDATLSPFSGSTTATYSTNDHLGSPSVIFDANTDRYRVSTLSLSSTTNYFISATIKGTGSFERVIADTYGFGAANGLEFFVLNRSLQIYANGFTLDTATSVSPNLRFIADNTWTDVALEKDGNLYRLFINGQVSVTGTSSITWSGFPYVTIGSGADYTPGNFLGSIANLTILQIPEPSAIALGLLGFLGLLQIRRRIT